jgi:hypothetical protein
MYTGFDVVLKGQTAHSLTSLSNAHIDISIALADIQLQMQRASSQWR